MSLAALVSVVGDLNSAGIVPQSNLEAMAGLRISSVSSLHAVTSRLSLNQNTPLICIRGQTMSSF